MPPRLFSEQRYTTKRIRENLLRWYARHRRSLPWRSDPTPYRVWVSEIMLQQTQVRTVLPYYDRFLARFPDVRTLAGASEDEVVAQWAGLGYYSRARNIHKAARKIVGEFGGVFPSSLDQCLALPGVGRYTAGAILSIAFNQPHPVVDGNVRRVISRLHGLREKTSESHFWKQASALVPPDQPSDFNQAMMELGALICLPSAPRCEKCPVKSMCAAYGHGIQESVPVRRSVLRVEPVGLVMLVIEHREFVLISGDLPASYIPGPYGLPSRLLRQGESPARAANALARRLKLSEVRLTMAKQLRHSITFHRMHGYVFAARLEARRPPAGNLRWVKRAETERLLTSSLFKKALSLTVKRAESENKCR